MEPSRATAVRLCDACRTLLEPHEGFTVYSPSGRLRLGELCGFDFRKWIEDQDAAIAAEAEGTDEWTSETEIED